ncbi:hypothetical protein [Paraflavitalea sp. CAU 1676]|uniref:hypothetical protein n=1 Tax=Paraflavitalea sp. CAU 1676 TaxID=3032598 RepID=UPI0023DCE9C3|nr:hypothetical protein [Paraflavitalea sp. CAU 1676]MDF2189776.1 hypothetical protein [Paraflavitalea sp. CAU 1676]
MVLLKLKWWWQLLILIFLSLVLYAPIISNSFLSDDFLVIRKVCMDGTLNINGFFRPLSDITLFLNYQITGLNPVSYYITNILLHALDTLLLFHFCRQWKWTVDKKKQIQFAALAALVFLTYPFHIEPVVWVLGRASLLASTFGMMALVIMVGKWKESWKLIGVAVCFFVAMTGYESVMVLPALVFIWLWFEKSGLRRYFMWMTVMGGVLVAHFLIRVLASGSVTGDYGAGMLNFSLPGLGAKIFKVLGRYIWPPLQNVQLITGLFIFSLLGFIVLFFLVWKRLKFEKTSVSYFLSLIAFFLVASLIPFLFGVSTHTSESDRFLHFPSFFLCALIAFVLIVFFYQKPWLRWVTVVIILYQLFYLQLSLVHWKKASGAVNELLSLTKQYSSEGKVYVINLPEEIEGAYVFRAGFQDALLLNRQDTASIVIVNQAKRDELRSWPGRIKPESTPGGLFIPPSVYFKKEPGSPLYNNRNNLRVRPFLSAKETILFWDREKWSVLQLNSSK